MTDKEMCAVFAKNLNNIMVDRGVKQADIVRDLRVAKSTVSAWCSGQNIPRTDALSRLTQMLCVNPSDLLEEEKPTPISESGLFEVSAIFNQLNPDNRAKLLELARLYLDHQRKSGEIE